MFVVTETLILRRHTFRLLLRVPPPNQVSATSNINYCELRHSTEKLFSLYNLVPSSGWNSSSSYVSVYSLLSSVIAVRRFRRVIRGFSVVEPSFHEESDSVNTSYQWKGPYGTYVAYTFSRRKSRQDGQSKVTLWHEGRLVDDMAAAISAAA